MVLGASSQKNKGSWETMYIHWSAFCAHTMMPMFSGLDARRSDPALCSSPASNRESDEYHRPLPGRRLRGGTKATAEAAIQ